MCVGVLMPDRFLDNDDDGDEEGSFDCEECSLRCKECSEECEECSFDCCGG